MMLKRVVALPPHQRFPRPAIAIGAVPLSMKPMAIEAVTPWGSFPAVSLRRPAFLCAVPSTGSDHVDDDDGKGRAVPSAGRKGRGVTSAGRKGSAARKGRTEEVEEDDDLIQDVIQAMICIVSILLGLSNLYKLYKKFKRVNTILEAFQQGQEHMEKAMKKWIRRMSKGKVVLEKKVTVDPELEKKKDTAEERFEITID